MTNKFGRTRQRTNNLGDEQIWGRTQVTQGWCIIAPIEQYSDYIYFQQENIDA